MASLSMLLNLADELDRESHSYSGNDFGLGLSPYLIHRHPHREPINRILTGYNFPLSVLNRLNEREASRFGGEKKESRVSPVGKDGFQVCMDVGHFKPSELNVKVLDNNSILVEGKHEEREDNHGFIQRHFVRRYTLPKGYNADNVVSTLSSDGVLTVSVPKPQEEPKKNERVIQIQQTGPAHLNVRQNSVEKIANAAKEGESNGEKEEKN